MIFLGTDDGIRGIVKKSLGTDDHLSGCFSSELLLLPREGRSGPLLSSGEEVHSSPRGNSIEIGCPAFVKVHLSRSAPGMRPVPSEMSIRIVVPAHGLGEKFSPHRLHPTGCEVAMG
jgi:hypothetical protein